MPPWVVGAHLAFLVLTVLSASTPEVFIGGFLFFLGLPAGHRAAPAGARPAPAHARRLLPRPGWSSTAPGCSGGFEPILSHLTDTPLFLGAVVLTAFNDNAAVTYLASLVPGLSAS